METKDKDIEARKVFISFLGTNNYVECRYDYNGQISAPVRFVQEVLIEQMCKEWTANDRIFIFCTRTIPESKYSKEIKGSKETNWVDNGQERISADIEKIGLEHRLTDLKKRIELKAEIEQVDIKPGFSEDEVWDIFTTVLNCLDDGDQIYFDVTHAFRSIPLFSVVLFNYSKFMKGTKLISIKYGAFEKLGPANKVKQINVEERIAPIIDLTNIARLQEYNQIASNLEEFGKVKKLSENISQNKEDETDDAIYNLGLSIGLLDEYISTIQLNNLKKGEYISYFRDSLMEIKEKENNIPQPIMEILNRLEEETILFAKEDSNQNIEAAIEWANKHEMVIQEYSLAEEYIINRVIQIVAEDGLYGLEYKDQWEIVSSLLSMPDRKYAINSFDKGVLKDNFYFVKRIKDKNSNLLEDLRSSKYQELRKRRNALAHATGEYDYNCLKDDFYTLYESCKNIVDYYSY